MMLHNICKVVVLKDFVFVFFNILQYQIPFESVGINWYKILKDSSHLTNHDLNSLPSSKKADVL